MESEIVSDDPATSLKSKEAAELALQAAQDKLAQEQAALAQKLAAEQALAEELKAQKSANAAVEETQKSPGALDELVRDFF